MNGRLWVMLALATLTAPAVSLPAYAYTEQEAADRISESDFGHSIANTSYYGYRAQQGDLHDRCNAWNGFYNDPAVPSEHKIDVAANLMWADEYLDACEPDLTDANTANDQAHWWYDTGHWNNAYTNADQSILLYGNVIANTEDAGECLTVAETIVSYYGH